MTLGNNIKSNAMLIKLSRLSLLVSLLVIQAFYNTAAATLTCQVEFRAKRTVEDSRWFGSVERPEFKSGVASGTGKNLPECEQNALQSVSKEGWQITYQKTIPDSPAQ